MAPAASQRERSRSPARQNGTKIIDGRVIAAELCRDVKTASLELQAKYGVTPGLAIIEVGHHNYGQLLDTLHDIDGPDLTEEHAVRHSNYAELKAKMAERRG
ncbi:unnamed protein product, partial [Polarella glacialis]